MTRHLRSARTARVGISDFHCTLHAALFTGVKMYGMPSDFAPTGFDPSMLLALGLPARRCSAVLILIAMVLGIVTLPVFFLILCVVEPVLRRRRRRDRLVPGQARAHHVPRPAPQPAPHVADLSRSLRPHAGALPSSTPSSYIHRQRDHREGSELQGHRHAQDAHPQPDAAGLLHRVQAAALRREGGCRRTCSRSTARRT